MTDYTAAIAAVTSLLRELDEVSAYAGVLKGALAAQGFETMARPGAWATKLTPQEQALVGALLRAYPRVLSPEHLLNCMPGHDHAEERQVQLVVVKVSHVRKKLGRDAILTVHGAGFAMGHRLHDVIHGAEAA